MTAPQATPGPGVFGGVLRRFGWLVGSFWFREALQAAFTICLARLESAAYAQFFLALSLGQMVLFFSEFGLNQHLMVLLSRRDARPAELMIQACALKAALLLLALAGLLGFVYWQGYPWGQKLAVLALSFGMGLEALASTIYTWLQVQGRQAAEAGIRAGAGALGFGHAFAALGLGATAWLVMAFRLVESLAALAGGMAMAWRTFKGAKPWPDLDSLWGRWRGGLVFTAISGAALLYNRINIFFLASHGDAQALAQYGVTWQLVEGITSLVVSLLLTRVMLPRFLGLAAGGPAGLAAPARQAGLVLLMASLVLALVLAADSEFIISLVYGPGYARAAAAQKWLSLAVVLGIMHNLAWCLMIAMGRARLLLAFFLATLGLTWAACALLVPAHPLEGAVSAILAGKAFLASLSLGYCQVRLRLFGWRRALLVTGAGAAGFLLSLAGRMVGPGLACLGALAPLAWLAWRWRAGLADVFRTKDRA